MQIEESANQARARGAERREHVPVDIDLVALESAPEPHSAATRRTLPTREEALGFARSAVAPPRSWVYHVAKRALDVVGATVLLILASPVIAIIALLIRIDSPGPVIFRQHRVGQHGRLFRFVKFRTMYVDACERFPDLYAYDYAHDEIETLYFKLPYDPRCSRVGRWLRRTSLDELPNLVNVLTGSMSLVGPRPELPEMLPYYEPDQYRKFAVKPGVTGLAQTSGRNILRFVETNAKDMTYVDTRSLRLDVMILIRTVGAVVLMVGAH